MYRVRLKNKARRQLDKIFGGRDRDRIVAAISTLADNPRPSGVKKLRNNIHRIRVGDWRIIFVIYDIRKQVVIGKISRRSEDTYNDVEGLF